MPIKCHDCGKVIEAVKDIRRVYAIERRQDVSVCSECLKAREKEVMVNSDENAFDHADDNGK